MSIEYAARLKAAILSQNKPELIKLKSELASSEQTLELFQCLDFSPKEQERLAQNPQWMADFYQMFASPYGNNGAETSDYGRESALEELGQAFVNVLLSGLPDKISDLPKYEPLASLRAVDDNEYRFLAEEPDVVSAGETGTFLAQRGLRPSTFHMALEELAMFVENLREDGELQVDGTKPVRLCRDPLETDKPLPDGIEFNEAAFEIAHSLSIDLPEIAHDKEKYSHVSQIPLPRSSAALNWLMDASISKPFLFPGLMAMPYERDLMLWAFPEIDNYEARWSMAGDFLEDLGYRKLLEKRAISDLLKFNEIFREKEAGRRGLPSLYGVKDFKIEEKTSGKKR